MGLVGVSTGATLALLAAEKEDVARHVSVVAGVAPHADVKTLLRIATTGHYQENGRLLSYEADPYVTGAITQSLVSTLPPARIGSAPRGAGGGGPAKTQISHRSHRPPWHGDGGPERRRVAREQGPRRFDELYAGLSDGVRAKLEEPSPLAGDERVNVPVELISGPHDKYFPLSETYALGCIALQARVTVSGALDHVEPVPSFRDLPAFLRVNGFVVRSLREARL